MTKSARLKKNILSVSEPYAQMTLTQSRFQSRLNQCCKIKKALTKDSPAVEHWDVAGATATRTLNAKMDMYVSSEMARLRFPVALGKERKAGITALSQCCKIKKALTKESPAVEHWDVAGATATR